MKGLGVHKDSRDAFEWPVYTLRLLDGCPLTFGCTGVGRSQQEWSKFYSGTPEGMWLRVPQPRGALLVMSGIAAETYSHCIRPQDLPADGVVATVIMRRVKQQAVIQ